MEILNSIDPTVRSLIVLSLLLIILYLFARSTRKKVNQEIISLHLNDIKGTDINTTDKNAEMHHKPVKKESSEEKRFRVSRGIVLLILSIYICLISPYGGFKHYEELYNSRDRNEKEDIPTCEAAFCFEKGTIAVSYSGSGGSTHRHYCQKHADSAPSSTTAVEPQDIIRHIIIVLSFVIKISIFLFSVIYPFLVPFRLISNERINSHNISDQYLVYIFSLITPWIAGWFIF